MALLFGLLCGLCAGTVLDIRVDLDLRLAANCNIGTDLQLPVSTSSPPENVVRFALSNCENRLDLGWTLYPNDTIVFQLTRNGSFSAQCVSDKATLAPCTIYAQPSIAEIFKLKPTAIYPNCTAPNSLLPAAPMSVTTAPSLDVVISGGIATGVGYCSASSYLYYMPPQEFKTTTTKSSGTCDIVIYNYTDNGNGNITHYLRSRHDPPDWWVNCSTTPSNSTCSATYSPTPSIIYLYSFAVLRYGPIAQSINTGVCGQSQAPTTAAPNALPTAPTTLTPTSPGTTYAPTRTPTSPIPTAVATTNTTNGGAAIIPGLFSLCFCVFFFDIFT